MADPHSRSINYSALPVFSGDLLAATPPSELMAPRLSGIPLLVTSPKTRRHFSAQTDLSREPPPPVMRGMPKSQSMRAIPTYQPKSGAPPPLSGLRMRPKHSPLPLPQNNHQSNSPSASKFPHSPVRTVSNNQSSLTGATGQTPPKRTSTRTISHTRGKEKTELEATRSKRVPARLSANTSTGTIGSAGPPSCASATTAASAAKKTTRSVSLRSISSHNSRDGKQSQTVAPPVPAVPISHARRIPTSSSTRSLHHMANGGPASQINNTRSTQTQPKPQPRIKELKETRVSKPVATTAAHTSVATSFTSSNHVNNTSSPSTVRVKRQPMTSSQPLSMSHSQSVPFNLAQKNTARTQSERPKPKLDLGRLPHPTSTATKEPQSARSSKSSNRSFSEATQRFLGKIRSAASSRASVRTPVTDKGPTNLASSPEDSEWEEVTISREPTETVKEKLALLTLNEVHLTGISSKYDEAYMRLPSTGPNMAKTCAYLTPAERSEILDYKNVFYAGRPGVVKNRSNFTDDNGNYRPVRHDHIAFRYEIISELGKGSFGKVLQCRDYKTGRLIAIKMTCNRKEMRRQARVEAQLLQNLAKAGNPDQHHFLRYLGSFMFRDHFCICSEILGNNLYDLLRKAKYKGLDYDLVRYITRQLVDGLEFLDLQGIIHCDLKPENILISDQGKCQVKIIDFGTGCYETSRVYTYIQSRFYRAPEILLGIPYSTAIDMWSLGCIVPELLLGKPLFPGEDEADQIACLCQTLGVPDQFMLKSCSRASVFFDARGNPISRRSPDGIIRGVPGSKGLDTMLPPVAADFVSKILQWSPHKRLSAGGALFHEFIFGV